MLRRWMPSEDIAVRLADALDAEDGGRRLLELARRIGRTEAAVGTNITRLGEQLGTKLDSLTTEVAVLRGRQTERDQAAR